MEVHFTPEVEAKIQRAAAEHSSRADTYVQQLVERHLDHDSWFRQQVKKGLDQLDRGEFLTHEEVGARMEKMLRP
jgi:predicted transcriptional regulator